MDYESLILDRQDRREHALDQCDGNCEYCEFAERAPIRYAYEEPKIMCSLIDAE